MKIYCNRVTQISETSLEKDRIAFFNSLVGKDLWLLCRMFDGMSYYNEWLQFVEEWYEEDEDTMYYVCKIGVDETTNTYYELAEYRINIVFPIELLNTEELVELRNNTDED